jgi:hypothetical protein
MTQLGHTDPKFTLKVYAQTMAFGDDHRARLEALVNGASLADPQPIKEEIGPREPGGERPHPSG